MSALGQKQTFRSASVMSALPPKNGHSHRKQRCLLRASSGHFVMTRGDPKLIFFRVFEHPTRITKKSGPSEGKMEDSFKIVTGSGAIGLSCFFC
jgi:hypothetical protein